MSDTAARIGFWEGFEDGLSVQDWIEEGQADRDLNGAR